MAQPSDAVLRARARRLVSSDGNVLMEWNGDAINSLMELSFEQRVRVATELVRSRVIKNISTPVERVTGPRGGIQIIRSKPGEFPRAETTQLLKSIFSEVVNLDGKIDGIIGTHLFYGVILELKLRRSFLARTVRQERNNIQTILGEPLFQKTVRPQKFSKRAKRFIKKGSKQARRSAKKVSKKVKRQVKKGVKKTKRNIKKTVKKVKRQVKKQVKSRSTRKGTRRKGR